LQVDGVALPPEVAQITRTIDAVDAALALVAGLGQSVELTARHNALCRQRRTEARLQGTFEVVRDFDYRGTRFTRGMLIDRSVLPDGSLYRFLIGRDLRVLEDSATVAA
jgi:hypothetical protein